MKTQKVETFGDEQKVISTRHACHVCHGMGHIERPNGDTIDCPVRRCENGYITIKKE